MSTHLLLDVPFIPEPDYVTFLSAALDRIGSVHFSLGVEGVPDARHRMESAGTPPLASLLATLESPAKYGLLNAPFNSMSLYRDPGPLVHSLEELRNAGQLDGVVFADGYLLRALGAAAPGLAGSLRAVPSVNTRIDSPARLDGQLRVIEMAGFLPPDKLIPDRRLNRDMDDLETLAAHARRVLDEVQIILLANEGCLAHCPYKPAHDALTCAGHLRTVEADHFPVAREHGCVAHFAAHPEEIFRSPFIRPEDADHYAHVADGLKLCGRTRGAHTMSSIIEAYLGGRFEGNLLYLLDSLEPLEKSIFVDNSRLPDDFAARHVRCAGPCGDCSVCASLARDHVVRRRPGLSPM